MNYKGRFMLKKFFAVFLISSPFICPAQPATSVPLIPNYCPGQNSKGFMDKINGETVFFSVYVCDFTQKSIFLACGQDRAARLEVKIGEPVQCPENPKLNYLLKSVDPSNRTYKLHFQD